MTNRPRSPLLHELFRKGSEVHYAAGEILGSTGREDPLRLVSSGYIKRYMIRDDGAVSIQIIYGPQDLFSLTRIYADILGQSLYEGRETYFYAAITNSTVQTISIDELVVAVSKDPRLYQELFSEAGRHLKNCVHSLENIASGEIYRRVAHHLVFLLQEYGRDVGASGRQMTVPLTHQEIAEMLGVTRPSVSLAISKLKSQQIIREGRQTVVPEMEMLRQAAFAK